MKNWHLCLAIAFAIVIGGGKTTSALSSIDEAQMVRQVFEGYKQAVLSDNGEAAASFLSQETIDYYGDMQKFAVCASPQEVRTQSMANRMQVLLLRWRVPPELLPQMSELELVAYAVNQGWIGKSSVGTMNISDVTVSDSVAVAQVIKNDQPSRIKFRFLKQSGAWKFDLMPLLQVFNVAFKELATQSGIEENKFIFMMLESLGGKQPTEQIWQPVSPEAELCR
jgi:hypothetical protein